MFIGLANYFRDHVPNITEMLKPLRDMILVAKGANLSKKLIWTEERIAAFKECQIAVSNCQQLYFLDDTTTPILQTDASDYGLGAYFYEIRDGKVRVIRFLSKSLTGAQLNWSTIEKECYGLYWAVKMLEEYLDNRRFILKTDHKNLTYINKTPKGKVLRWKLFLQGFDFLLYHIPGKEIHQNIPDALSRLCANLIEVVTLSAIDNKERIPGNLYRKISAVHNSEVGHMGLQITKDRLNDKTISDRWIKLFIKQCPCCQVMSRAHLAIRTHPFTCAAYYPFEVIALDHIGPLVIDEKGHQYVLVIIDAFSRWVELYPTKGVTADETAKCIFQHLGRFGAPERILTDRGTAFHNELVSELLHMCRAEHELTIAYSKEENAIVERANQEVIRHLRALLFDKRVYNKWSFEELPLVQRIMNTVEKTATGVTPAELILNNSLRLTKSIFTEPSTMDRSRLKSMSGQLDSWISRQAILVKVAQENQKATDLHRMSVYDDNYTDYPINSYVLYTHPNGKEHKLRPEHSGPYQVMNRLNDIYSIQDLVSGKVIDTHVHQLRPFNYDPERTRPVDIARQTAQEFLIGDILAHRGDRNRRSTMEFLVRWEDFTGADSWEPYAGLRHAEKLHEYLRVHKMRSLIPVEHK
jgi:hypothetical protein